MKILILNAGSSSLKFCVYEMPSFNLLARGVCERIGLNKSFIHIKGNNKNVKHFRVMKNHLDALQVAIRHLTYGETKVVKSAKEFKLIGHMFVHGGKMFKPTIVNNNVISYLKSAVDYAPVHMPKSIAIVEYCHENYGKCIPNVLYFDSNFHSTMPAYAYSYAINKKYTTKYRIRKYGFHGSSHEFMLNKVMEKNDKANKIITCHLGNGCSISAIKNGKCIDTTMGFTPLEGLIMGTRSGSIDPSVITFIADKYNIEPKEVTRILNEESGLVGICGYSDLRDIEKRMLEGNKNCALALDMYCYSIIKQIGAYICAMQGVDVITFGGGVGENSSIVRQRILDHLNYIGITYNKEINAKTNRSPDILLSLPDSKVDVYVISTNEEFIVANKIYNFYLEKVKNF